MLDNDYLLKFDTIRNRIKSIQREKVSSEGDTNKKRC